MSKTTPDGGGPIVASWHMTQEFKDGYPAHYQFSGDKKIDVLLAGTKWGSKIGEGVTLTYSFPKNNSVWAEKHPDSEAIKNKIPFESAHMQAARLALEAWSDIANITFQEVNENSHEVGDLRFSFTKMEEGTAGYTRIPFVSSWNYSGTTVTNYVIAPESADIWINDENSSNPAWEKGSDAFHTLMHEIGHGLGLKHPFDKDPENGAIVIAPAEKDSYQYSIMSYTKHPAMPYLVEEKSDSWVWTELPTSTPMLYDIAAIQYLYGANTNTRSGNDTYTFDADKPFIKTIWDGGGTDTIDASNQQYQAIIDLREGHFSSIGLRYRETAENKPSFTPDPAENNVAIAYNTKIENAVGTKYNDTIYGNDLDNMLTGGKGDDEIYGGKGNDTAVFSGLSSTYTCKKGSSEGSWTVTGPDGTDRLYSVEHLKFDDITKHWDASIPQPEPTPEPQPQFPTVTNKAFLVTGQQIQVDFNVRLFRGGSNAPNVIRLGDSASVTFTPKAADRVEFTGNLNDYVFTPKGNSLLVQNENGQGAYLRGLSGNASRLVFADGSAHLSLNGAKIMLGDCEAKGEITCAKIGAAWDTTLTSALPLASQPQPVKVFLDGSDQNLELGFYAKLFTTSGQEKIKLQAGTKVEGLKLEIGDELKLPGTSAHYTLEQHGTRLTVKDDNGTLANLTVNGKAGMLSFDDYNGTMALNSSGHLVFTGQSGTLEATLIGTTIELG